MPRDYLNATPTTMRRDDRAVTDEAWIKCFLQTTHVGTLATVHDGQPFINQNLFVYDADRHCIYTHTARVGRTRANVDQGGKVSFSVMEMGRMLPAPEALEFSVEYAGVMIFGSASVVEDEREATAALQALLDKYAPHLRAGEDYRPPVPEELARTAVFKITIESWSGKQKTVGAHEGAFWLPAQPMLASARQRTMWQGSLAAISFAPDSESPLQFPDEAQVVAGKGLVGDRYFGKAPHHSSPDTPRHITLIAQEDLDAVQAQHGFPITHDQTRRNLLTVGVPLMHLIGKRFRIGEAIFEGVESCEPCDGLAQFSGYGKPVIAALLHRAGIRAAVVESGMIRKGDTITPE